MSGVGGVSSEHEVVRLTQVALELATFAVHFDAMQQTVSAIDYYDKSILHLDEVLNKLPVSSKEWASIVQLRIKYDERMETLRDMENSKFELSSFQLVSADSSSKRAAKTSRRKRQSLVDFEEDGRLMDVETLQVVSPFMPPPSSIMQRPYWQMKVDESLRSTVKSC